MQSLSGAQLCARGLSALGVKTVFCYPGGANLELLDALSRTAIALVRTEHEQGAVFAAQGYARSTGQLGVCMATSGPGATNLVTGIADANSDSVPLLAITGNVARHWLGRNAFQEVDIVSICRPITRRAVQISDPAVIEATLVDLASAAFSPRPGPVLIDLPKDVQQSRVHAEPIPTPPSMGTAVAPISDVQMSEVIALLRKARRPVIYAGGGVIASGTSMQLTALLEALQAPVVLTLMGLGAVASNHPLCFGPLGMHGAWCANYAVNEADVVLAVGVRFDDRVIGDPKRFAAGAAIIHIDIDPAELGKNRKATVAVEASLQHALPALLCAASPCDSADWLMSIRQERRIHPLTPLVGDDATLTGPDVVAQLGRRLPDNAIVTTGVGQHQMWAMQYLQPRRARSFLSSSGFGTMGFGLPAAIGAKQANPAATVIDIDGDGSLNMSINELATCRRYNLGVKVFVVNNQWLGMVRQWQDMIYDGNRVASELGHSSDGSAPYPDFLVIAAGYRIRSERATTPSELEPALARFLSDPDEPYLLDVIVRRDADVLPMIPSGGYYRDTIFAGGMPVEDT